MADVPAICAACLAASICTVIVVVVVRRSRLIRQHGRPRIPDDIAELREAFGKRAVDLVTADFRLANTYRDTHALYERTYAEANGHWLLQVETYRGHVVEYHAAYTSRISMLLCSSFSGNLGHSRLIAAFQSD